MPRRFNFRRLLLPTVAVALLFAACVWATDVDSDAFRKADLDHDGLLNEEELDTYLVLARTNAARKAGVPSGAIPAAGAGVSSGVPAGDVAAVGQTLFVSADGTILTFWPAFVNSLAMIIVTELGDKTFFIAAILAMKHDRLTVFLGAAAALIVMTVLSTLLGFAMPQLLPRAYTHYAATVLFAFFGVNLLREAAAKQPDEKNEELEEVEEELLGDERRKEDRKDVEAGAAAHKKMPPAKLAVMFQAFSMTFLAEWGDRSQIATIAMAAAKDPYGVTFGGFLGHSICTGLAVIGGRLLATRISERTVGFAGGALFLVFAVHSLIVGPDAM